MRRLTTHPSRPHSCWTNYSCPLVLALLLTVTGVAHAGQEDIELADIVRASIASDAIYHAPSSKQLRRIEALFLAMVSSDDNASKLPSQFEEFGYRLVFTQDGAGRKLRIAYEMEDRREGRGVYAVRSAATIPLVQAMPNAGSR